MSLASISALTATGIKATQTARTAEVTAIHVVAIALALRPQRKILRREPDPEDLVHLVDTPGLGGEHPLEEAGPQLCKGLPGILPVGELQLVTAPALAQGVDQRGGPIPDPVGHALPADALHGAQPHGHVLGAEVEIDLAAIVPVCGGLPGEAMYTGAAHAGELVVAPSGFFAWFLV